LIVIRESTEDTKERKFIIPSFYSMFGSGNTDFKSFAEVQVNDLISGKSPVIAVCAHTTIRDAAAILLNKNILSVPVLDEGNNSFVGFLDVLDLVNHTTLLHHHRQNYEAMEDLEEKQFSKGLVVDILKEEGLRKLHIFGTDAKLVNVMRVMNNQVFRVLVSRRDRSGWWYGKRSFYKIVHFMVSQTDIVDYIGRQPWAQSVYGGIPVGDVEHVMVKQITMAQGSPAIDAFILMIDEGVSAIPLVNSQGQMTGVISAADLRGISAEKSKNIVYPAETFVYLMTGKARKNPITCGANESLYNILNRIRAAKVHHCWVIDEFGRPIGCLSLIHIIKKTLKLLATST